MADELPSSPLSSPPESVIGVAIYDPLENENKVSSSADGPESPAATIEVISADGPESTAATIEVPANQPTASPKGDIAPKDSPTHDSDDGGQSSSQKRKASISRAPAPTKKARRVVVSTQKKSAQDRKWEAPFVYTDPKAPLAKADLRAILLHPDAWDILTPEEKRDVLAKFPDPMHILGAGTDNARPDTVSLRNDDNFRHDCARYCENIELGRHDEEWLSQAWMAHEKQKRGGFDEFLREQFEEDWEVRLPREEKVGEDEPGKDSLGSADSYRFAVQDAPALESTSRRSSRSSQPAIEAGNGTEEKGNNAAAPSDVQSGVAQSDSKAPQQVNPSLIGPANPSTAPQVQKEATSVVVVRSD